MTALPMGWSIATIDQVADISPRHPRNLEDSLPVTFVRMPALSETEWKFKSTEERPLGQVRKGFTHFAEGDVLFAKITPCMENGKAAVASHLINGLGCGTTELHVLRPVGGIDAHYIYYFIHRDSFREEAARNFTGSAGQLRVPASFVSDAQIPVPPHQEQRRIVAKLEKLLSVAIETRDSWKELGGKKVLPARTVSLYVEGHRERVALVKMLRGTADKVEELSENRARVGDGYWVHIPDSYVGWLIDNPVRG